MTSGSDINKHSDNSQELLLAEKLSDLLDDNASDSTIDAILDDSEQCEAWYRYNVVSSVLKKEHSAYSSFDFTKSVSEAIDAEPSIIARPAPKKSSEKGTKGNVVSLWKKAGGGLAIAASVAYAMVFSVQMMTANPESTETMIAEKQQQAVETQSVSAFEQEQLSVAEAAEQAQLDLIQEMLNQNRSALNISEQQVGGERIVSQVVTIKELQEFQKQINDMKKPSEVSKKSK